MAVRPDGHGLLPASGRVTPAFAAVAKHYGVGVDICPPRRGNRKGVVEKANHSAAQRWWRTLDDDTTVAAAQAGLDRLCARLDGRTRRRDGTRISVADLAANESLRAAPRLAFPAELTLARIVSPQGLVAFRGNSYSVPPGLGRTQVTVRHRLGADVIHIVTASGAVIAAHRRAPDGAGRPSAPTPSTRWMRLPRRHWPITSANSTPPWTVLRHGTWSGH